MNIQTLNDNEIFLFLNNIKYEIANNHLLQNL